MWIKTIPKKDGYYWLKANGDLTGKPFIKPVHLYNNQNTVFRDGENDSPIREDFEWWDEEIIPPILSSAMCSRTKGLV